MSNNADSEYFRLLNLVLDKGRVKQNRTGVPTRGVFGAQARFDLSEGFPLLTTKKVFFKGVCHELLWFLSGSTNIKYLVENGVHIWDDNCFTRAKQNGVVEKYSLDNKIDFIETLENCIESDFESDRRFVEKYGELGEGTYGGMWRAFPYVYDSPDGWEPRYVDQISKVIDSLTNNPDSRRHIVSAWHPYWVDYCALPPCHVLFQFHTEELTLEERQYLLHLKSDIFDVPLEEALFDQENIPKRRLNCQLYQRSCDLFLGVPFNIASYALLTHMVAQVTNMVAGDFIWTGGDVHLYENHLKQVEEQLKREYRPLPKLVLNPDIKNIFDFKYEDIKIEGYNPHPAIKGEVAV